MFHVEKVILNSEDQQGLVVQERKKGVEVIKNEIDSIAVSELGELHANYWYNEEKVWC